MPFSGWLGERYDGQLNHRARPLYIYRSMLFIKVVILDFLYRFGLFEAMSAIEMMDPKMDAGMMCNRGNKKVLNFDQAVAVSNINPIFILFCFKLS